MQGESGVEEWDERSYQVAIRSGVRKEPCVVCGLPVFLAEKLVIERSLYHRTCFRCARCNHQLTIGNYYETEDGQFCCETCPDEEDQSPSVMHQEYNQSVLFDKDVRFGESTVPLEKNVSDEYLTSGTPYQRALSDEEKSSKVAASSLSDARTSPRDETPSHVSQMRLSFITSHLLAEKDDPGETESPATTHPHRTSDNGVSRNESEPTDPKPSPLVLTDVFSSPSSSLAASCGALTTESQRLENAGEASDSKEEELTVHNVEHKSINSFRTSQHATAIASHDTYCKNRKLYEDTKDARAAAETEGLDGQSLSLVQQRRKLFENKLRTGEKAYKANEPNPVVVNISEESKPGVIEQKDPAAEESPRIADEGAEPEKKRPLESPVRELEAPDEEEVVDPAEPSKDQEEVAVAPEATVEIRDTGPTQAPALETSLTNMSGINLSVEDEDYPEELNPFQDDDEADQQKTTESPSKPAKAPSTNPFGSSDEEDEPPPVAPPRPAARKNKSATQQSEQSTKRRLKAPNINLNPFWSDDEPPSDEDEPTKPEARTVPVPKPRTSKPSPEPSPLPRKATLERGGVNASNTSIASSGSTTTTPGGTFRKKKPAPKPPVPNVTSTPKSSSTPTQGTPEPASRSYVQSNGPVHTTPRVRKAKPAPPPPMFTSTPLSAPDPDLKETDESQSLIWEEQKNNKDEANLIRQSLSTTSGLHDGSIRYPLSFVDKSSQGKWKRKKAPAPPRPMPHRRKIKVMSTKDVKLELDEIEMQQQGLEKQGVRLEQLIRDKCETGEETEEINHRIDVEELVLELFALVNEKNELFRRQAELTLLRRQQRLEEEHADVEYQIRCLMSQPEATKTDSDKQREEVLIQRLVEIVERRNEIVECLEMDRRREVEEDRSIHRQLGLFAAKNKGESKDNAESPQKSSPMSKKEKSKEKLKDRISKKGQNKKDADMDIDETEAKLKRHKKKWF